MTDIASQAPASAGPWDTNADFWVRIIRENRDKYRNELTNAAVLNAVGPPDHLAVLDAGCGEGYLGRLLANGGATVTGIDSSANLIEAARRQQLLDGLPVTFDVGSVDALPYRDGQFDLVVCNHVLNDLQDASQAISEFGRVMHSGGQLVILMLHPSFYNKHAERSEATNDSIAASYFELRHVDQTFKVDGLISPAANTAWFRPLEFYTQALSRAGFVITNLTEPHPTPEQVAADPWWRQGFTRPLFMLITAELR